MVVQMVVHGSACGSADGSADGSAISKHTLLRNLAHSSLQFLSIFGRRDLDLQSQ